MNGVLSLSGNRPRLGLIGNPENRRIVDFQNSCEALGWERSPCLSYEEILRAPESLDGFEVDLLRIDSPGKNERVAQGLIELGGGPANVELEVGEIAFAREYYRGFCKVLEWIEARGLPCLNAPADIRVMFDKWECHKVFEENEVRRPPAEMAPESFEELLEMMRARGSGQIFLKPLHGSSASGVCALRWTPKHQQMIAPLQIEEKRGRAILVNSRRVRTYTTVVDIEVILRLLLPQGMILEQWIPKMTLPGGAIDLRVLVIAGEARHWVVRQSRSPMTNLHLKNRRGDAGQFIEHVGPSKVVEAFDLAERAAKCFPTSMYAGVDILIDPRGRSFVGEINAFGDLLPRLMHRGETTYTAIARACVEQQCFA